MSWEGAQHGSKRRQWWYETISMDSLSSLHTSSSRVSDDLLFVRCWPRLRLRCASEASRNHSSHSWVRSCGKGQPPGAYGFLVVWNRVIDVLCKGGPDLLIIFLITSIEFNQPKSEVLICDLRTRSRPAKLAWLDVNCPIVVNEPWMTHEVNS